MGNKILIMQKLLWSMLSNIKNAQLINKTLIFQKKTTLCKNFLNLLWNEGLIMGYRNSFICINYYEIILKHNYFKNIALKKIKILYRKKKKIFLTLNQLWKLNYTCEILILITSKGFLTLKNCKRYKLGGKPFILIL